MKHTPDELALLAENANLSGPKPAANPVQVYLVLVFVRYWLSASDPVAVRFWPVRIVARSHDSAQIGAMNWAEGQKDVSIAPGAIATAVSASTIQTLAEIDCIAESVRKAR